MKKLGDWKNFYQMEKQINILLDLRINVREENQD